jgi:diadenosine tetraphosphate (Ap4A) HIT family hydrolase
MDEGQNMTIFHKIVSGEFKCFKVWEDAKHLAFLTPFPNTKGVTVVIPKKDPGDYVFKMSDEEYKEFSLAIKKVANILEKAFETKRVAMVFEGTGVSYVHAKLYPLHGTLNTGTEDLIFNENYLGYITTIEGPKMDDEELIDIQTRILGAQK